MQVELTLPMALVLLDLDDSGGHSLSDPKVFSILLAAAMFAELDMAGRIRHYDDGRIALKAGRPHFLLEQAEQALSARPVTIVQALLDIADESLRHTIHSQLVGVGALKVTSRKRMFLFKEWSWPTADPAIENSLRDHLRSYVEVAGGPVDRDDLLLVLVERGGLLHQVWRKPPIDAIRARTKGVPLREALKALLENVDGKVQLLNG